MRGAPALRRAKKGRFQYAHLVSTPTAAAAGAPQRHSQAVRRAAFLRPAAPRPASAPSVSSTNLHDSEQLDELHYENNTAARALRGLWASPAEAAPGPPGQGGRMEQEDLQYVAALRYARP